VMISGGRQGFDQKKMILEIDLPLQLVSRNCWHHRSFLPKGRISSLGFDLKLISSETQSNPRFKAKSSDSEQGLARALISFEVASKLGRVFYVQDYGPSGGARICIERLAENLHKNQLYAQREDLMRLRQAIVLRQAVTTDLEPNRRQPLIRTMSGARPRLPMFRSN
jgi:hypothetical protein